MEPLPPVAVPSGFATPEAIFYFDVVCPYAFISSERLHDIARVTGAKITWKPVLLGALYDLTKAPQGKDGSATSVMNPAKKAISMQDFQRECRRYQIPLKFHPQHPLRSVDAGRLLCAFPDHLRSKLAHALFRAYWFDGANINSRVTLLRIARSLKLTSVASPNHAGPFSLTPDLDFPLDETVFAETREDRLRANTQEAFELGAFGVPSFYIPATATTGAKFFWGQDRLHLFEAYLTAIKLRKPVHKLRALERFHPRCLRTPPEDRARTLKFWFDFSSPWSYLAWTQLERLGRDAGPGLVIELKPFLLGGLFRSIGTPLLPSSSMSEARFKYNMQDLADWSAYWDGVNSQEIPPVEGPSLKWPTTFPIRSVTSLRVALLDLKTVPAIYRAAWRDDKGISEDKVLVEVLNANGVDGESLVARATVGAEAETVKAQLRANTDEAVALGICGAPTFQMGEGEKMILIWGGDRLNQVADLVLGWRPEKSNLKASVAAFPHFDYRL